MHMNMIGDAGAGDSAKVHAHIKSLRLIDFSQRSLAPLHEIHHLIGDFLVCYRQIADVRVRRNHQMTADVRVPVEDYEVMIAAENYQVFQIKGGILLRFAKDAGRVSQLVWA